MTDLHRTIGPELAQLVADDPRPLALVTGASSGIGAAIAQDLAADRLVLAVGRDEDRLRRTVESAPPGSVIPLALDLREIESLSAAVSALPRLDALVHDAAIARRATVEDATPDLWRETLETNVIAPAELTRALLPQLRASRGAVVFISSGAARRSVPLHTVYSASKHALLALADGLRDQERAAGVRVSTLAPGPTWTPAADRTDAYPREEGADSRSDPATIARSLRHILDAPEDSQITDVWVRPRF